MQKNIVLEPAFVLQSRPYRETSLLVDFWCRNTGRFSGIIKGIKKSQPAWLGLLQHFTPLLVSAVGHGELKTVTYIELKEMPFFLKGRGFYCAFYLNELVQRAIYNPFDAYPELFDFYGETLGFLAKNHDFGAILRAFERVFLKQLGYELRLDIDIYQQRIDPLKMYFYEADQGFSLIELVEPQQKNRCFLGASLLAFDQGLFANLQMRTDAKRLMRLALLPYVGYQKFESAQFFKMPDLTRTD